MRILSYNIREGAFERIYAVADVIRAADADAVALQEATRESAEVLASAFGAEVVFGEGNSAAGLHVAWLTRRPIRASAHHHLGALSKSLLAIELDGVRLSTAHLASRHEVAAYPQEGEVAAILDVLGDVETAQLLAGDLNTLRAGDPVGDPPPGVALRPAARTILDPLDDAGYVDCFRALHPDDPGFTYEAAHPWLRIDYAFASPSLAPRVRACEVVDTPLARRASDHLPLLVELD